MKDTLLTKVYNAHRDVLVNEIGPFYSNISDSFNKFDTDNNNLTDLTEQYEKTDFHSFKV